MVTMRIDHYREPCWGAQPGFCLRVVETSDPEVDFADEIAGFEHQWGHVYEVVVLVTDVDDSGEGGPWREYDLVEVMSDEPVEAQSRFVLELGPEFIPRIDRRSFELVANEPVACETEQVCKDVASAVVEGMAFEVELSHAARGGGAMVAHGVTVLE